MLDFIQELHIYGYLSSSLAAINSPVFLRGHEVGFADPLSIGVLPLTCSLSLSHPEVESFHSLTNHARCCKLRVE